MSTDLIKRLRGRNIGEPIFETRGECTIIRGLTFVRLEQLLEDLESYQMCYAEFRQGVLRIHMCHCPDIHFKDEEEDESNKPSPLVNVGKDACIKISKENPVMSHEEKNACTEILKTINFAKGTRIQRNGKQHELQVDAPEPITLGELHRLFVLNKAITGIILDTKKIIFSLSPVYEHGSRANAIRARKLKGTKRFTPY